MNPYEPTHQQPSTRKRSSRNQPKGDPSATIVMVIVLIAIIISQWMR